MSAPPSKYVRVYDFNSFQSSNPTTPLPGLQVDGELNALKATTDATIDRLAQVQRADGALANISVTVDSLASDVLALIGGTVTLVRRGAWLTATAYALNDVVTIANASYLCILAHTSGTFATDLAAMKWALLSSPGIAADGSTIIIADIPLNTHKLTGVADGIANTDAATVGQVSALVASAVPAAVAAAISSASTTVQGIVALDTEDQAMTGDDATQAVTSNSIARALRGAKLASFALSR